MSALTQALAEIDDLIRAGGKLMLRRGESLALPSTKPQGLYASFQSLPGIHDLTPSWNFAASPGKAFVPRDLSANYSDWVDIPSRGGKYPPSVGIASLIEMLGDAKVRSMVRQRKPEILPVLSELYPDVDWSRYMRDRYADSYSMLEGLAGMTARNNGFDSLVGLDRTRPGSSEISLLQDNLISPEYLSLF